MTQSFTSFHLSVSVYQLIIQWREWLTCFLSKYCTVQIEARGKAKTASVIRRRWSLTVCCFNLMSQLSGWLGCRQMAVYPLLCTNQLCVAVITMVSRALDDEFIRFCVYPADMIPHDPTNQLSITAITCVWTWQATPVQFYSEYAEAVFAGMIICNRGNLSMLLQLTERTAYRHLSDIL